MILLAGVVLAGAWRCQSRLDDRLDPALAGTEVWVRGTVASLPERAPDHLRFLFRPTDRQAALAGLPRTLQLRWYEDVPELGAGQAWRLKLRLRPPRGLVNFQGFDREQVLFAAGVGALGSVLGGERLAVHPPRPLNTDGLRDRVRDRIREVLPAGPGRALVLSLAIADRSELHGDDWSLLRTTGTGHLLAISGLHVGLAAVAGFWLTRGLLFLIPWLRGSRAVFIAACAGAWLSALAYGVLAGFPVSTLRALAMLAVALCVIAARRGSGAFQAWLLAVLAVLAIDPFAPLTPGFWLSFAAVLALIIFFAPRGQPSNWWSALPRAQMAVMVVMLPLAALWFQSGSWLAFPANLLAIPWVSFVSVPLVLAGVAAGPLPALANLLLELAWWSCASLHEFLQAVAGIEGGRRWLTPGVGAMAAALGLGGGLLLLLPRGLAVRWLGLCLLAIVFLPRAAVLAEGEYSVETLDVGQGLAVLVKTRNHSLLYDTGPGGSYEDGKRWSLFDPVIAPALAADGGRGPDLVAVSHADLDHAGGLPDLLARFGEVELRINDRDGGGPGCSEGWSWTWDAVHFRAVHPSGYLPYLGNDSSCVISVDNGRHRTLLAGDISTVVEDRIAGRLAGHHLITVPHHGSASSSGPALIAATRPAWAVVSAAYGNRFGFPRREVLERYHRQGAAVLSTTDCGALRAVFPRRGDPAVVAARVVRDRPWRWQPEEPCMVTSNHAMYHLERPESRR